MLLDFGVAKEAALDSGSAGRSVRSYSLNYAPIEQIKGTGTDRRSDLYSAAATIYHLMTGVVQAYRLRIDGPVQTVQATGEDPAATDAIKKLFDSQ